MRFREGSSKFRSSRPQTARVEVGRGPVAAGSPSAPFRQSGPGRVGSRVPSFACSVHGPLIARGSLSPGILAFMERRDGGRSSVAGCTSRLSAHLFGFLKLLLATE